MTHRVRMFLPICLFAGAFIVAGSVLAAADDAATADAAVRQPWLHVGGRIGVTYEFGNKAEFNNAVQQFYPNNFTYFPLYSRVGAALSERVPIGKTGHRFTVSQLLEVTGLDQNFALPSLTLLMGVETSFGLEAGLGPKLELSIANGGYYLAPSLVYAVGWRFQANQVEFPVAVLVEPFPPQRRVRVSIIAGIDYGIPRAEPKPQKPFNY